MSYAIEKHYGNELELLHIIHYFREHFSDIHTHKGFSIDYKFVRDPKYNDPHVDYFDLIIWVDLNKDTFTNDDMDKLKAEGWTFFRHDVRHLTVFKEYKKITLLHLKREDSK